MSENLTPETVIERLRKGDASAANEVFHRYATRLVALAGSRLDERMRRKVDPEEVVQSAFRSFFRRADQFEVDNWESLWGLLVQFTLRKCGRRLQYFRAARRDVRREAKPTSFSQEEQNDLADLAADPSPSPAEVALLADTAEYVMQKLGSERKQKIFELSLQGYSIDEISAETAYYRRGVERVRAQIKELLLEMLADRARPDQGTPGNGK
jgi:RNA polymerase sigma-70 factor, ECF subfamily